MSTTVIESGPTGAADPPGELCTFTSIFGPAGLELRP